MSILQNNKKAAAGIGAVAAAAAVLALGAGTYAAFTDTENAQATFAAGTLDLELGGSLSAGTVNLANLAPGDVVTKDVTIDNVGTVDGVLSFTATTTQDDNGCGEAEEEAGGCGTGQLAENITVEVEGQTATLSDLQNISLGGIPLDAQPGAQTYTFTFTVNEAATSAIQSDTATVDIAATLEQATS